MQIWGKVIGALVGFVFGRIVGAILGLIVGHMFDKTYSRDFASSGGFARFFANKDDFQQQAEFFHCLFSALGHICKADGKVTHEDIAVASRLMDDMALNGDVRREAQDAFREGKERDFPLQEMLQEFRRSCHGRRDILQIFMEILIQAACEKSRLSMPKMALLEKIAQTLGFNRQELGFFVSTFEAGSRFRRHQQHAYEQRNQQQSKQYSERSSKEQHSALDDAYRILGVSKNDDVSTIKRAYKKAMATHHPDKLMSKGLPKQALDMAKSKTQDIQAAYSLIRSSRGF